MSILDDNLDISQKDLIKARLVELIGQSDYLFANIVDMSNIRYEEPSITENKYKFNLSIAMDYIDESRNPKFVVKWIHREDFTPTMYHTVRIDKCTIDLDEFEKNKGYGFEIF